MTGHPMSGHHYTPAEYALQQIVEYFANLHFQWEEAHSTPKYRVVFRSCELKTTDYVVLRYLNTGGSQFEEFSEELFYDGGVQSMSIRELDLGRDLIWQLLNGEGKRLSFRKK